MQHRRDAKKTEEERETGKRRWKGSVATLATGAVMAGIPCPTGIAAKAWRLLAIFLANIVAMVAQPLPSGACALIALDVSVATKTLAFEDAFSAFATQVPWLIFCAMAMAQTMKSTGLGERIAFVAVARFGKTTMGLCYSLVFSEALLAPLIPSVAARAGGIMLPIIVSMSRVCGSTTEDDAQAKMGAFLVASYFQCSAVTSAMFLNRQPSQPPQCKSRRLALGKGPELVHVGPCRECARAGLHYSDPPARFSRFAALHQRRPVCPGGRKTKAGGHGGSDKRGKNTGYYLVRYGSVVDRRRCVGTGHDSVRHFCTGNSASDRCDTVG